MVVHDALTNSEADTRTGDIPPVQTFEDAKDPLMIFRRNPNSIIFYRKDPVVVAPLRRDMDFRLSVFRTVLQGIANQVLEQLNDMGALGYYGG